MAATEKIKETRENFLKQANTRIKDLKGIRSDIKRRQKELPKEVQNALDEWAVKLDMYINLALVEIELVENSDQNLWGKLRTRVDEAIGKAERETETGYEILENPKNMIDYSAVNKDVCD
ncbi:MAG: hypothetical protein JXQ82_03240 [Methanomicrobiaceae archaeon]|nr:hypothetical protein [Methanomicrobiaceae archaeon]